MAHRFCFFVVLFLALPFHLLAKEKIKINTIEDANLFVSSTGRHFRLADVNIFSIHDADSLKRRFALQVMARAEKELLTSNWLYAEWMQTMCDAPSRCVAHA